MFMWYLTTDLMARTFYTNPNSQCMNQWQQIFEYLQFLDTNTNRTRTVSVSALTQLTGLELITGAAPASLKWCTEYLKILWFENVYLLL